MTKGSERLSIENNHLHLRLIQETEKQESNAREHLKQQKGLQDAVAELKFWKSSQAAKQAALETENASLKGKMHELLEACQQAASDGENGAAKQRNWSY